MRKLDSLNAELKQMQDSTAQAIYFKNNNNALLALVHENKKIKMKSALTNIAIGIGFLAILVIGLLRKPKQKK
ncbi:MAG: hypothetical protein IPP48_07085 [Chitinophagaceae bacterium]|nr:hypothetical protein [Chitinophagaceae bacterium]